ncbi:MAG: hypothetical protein LC808_12660 [Actinobacteria bacterium]|nr:hypothetical protein [Actinomycetota bacterium]
MNEETARYLDGLKLADPVTARVAEISSAFEFLCRSAPDRLFISDVVDETTGERRYESLWGFAGAFWLEARNFTKQNDVDISPYVGSIYYLGLQHENVSFPSGVDDTSRLLVEVQTDKVSYSTLSATGENCKQLLLIVEDLLLPNLKVLPTSQ